MSKVAIIIPARYASTRFPGKPLAKIAGKEMLLRVWGVAQKVVSEIEGVAAYVATDDERIENFCKEHDINYIMTSEDCETGTDRVIEAIEKLDEKPEFVVNMQGDNPFCPPWFVADLIKAYNEDNSIMMATPAVNLSWKALDVLREHKKETPFSGTTVTMDFNGDAMYFSKNIIPGVRKEEKIREETETSPVYRQPGLYGYKPETLTMIKSMDKGYYERLEGLEQLRLMENGIKIRCVKNDYREYEDLAYMSGVDTPQDVERAEKLYDKYGDLF